MTVTFPHLLFLTVMYGLALLVWVTDRRWPWTDTGAVVGAVVVALYAAGLLIGAWV